MSTKALREKRARVIEQAKGVMATAEAEGRAMNAGETQSWDGWMNEADTLKVEIDRLERMEDAERSLEQSRGRAAGYTSGTFGSDTNNDALRSWLLAGVPASGVTGDRNLTFSLRSDPLRSLRDRESWESRALSTGTPSAGGNLVPQGFVNSLEVALLSFGGMRQAASVIRTESGNDLPWPTENDTMNEGVLLGENVAATEQDIEFGQTVFKAHKYSSQIVRVPVELIQDSAVNLGEEVGRILGERLGRIGNRHFTTGTGTNQPQGIVPAAALGIAGSTGSATSVNYDRLVDLQHSVDPSYRSGGAQFMFHDNTLREIKKLKDGDGRPLWSAGLAVREPDTILGHSYIVNQHMAPMAANARSIVFGDLSKYKIRDVRDVVLMRLDERFAEFHQVAFLAFARWDGRLLNAGTNPVKYYQNSAT